MRSCPTRHILTIAVVALFLYSSLLDCVRAQSCSCPSSTVNAPENCNVAGVVASAGCTSYTSCGNPNCGSGYTSISQESTCSSSCCAWYEFYCSCSERKHRNCRRTNCPNVRDGTCAQCNDGYYSESSTSTKCTLCPEGYYLQTAGNSSSDWQCLTCDMEGVDCSSAGASILALPIKPSYCICSGLD